MQLVVTIWDNGRDGSVYDRVNGLLKKGARVAAVTSTAPTEETMPWACVTFVIEGTPEQLAR